MKKRIVSLSLDPKIIEWIDEARGQIPRSTFANDIFAMVKNVDEVE